MDTLRKTNQWFIRCILPQLPHKLPGALPRPTSPSIQQADLEASSHGSIDVPLVRSQIRRAEMVKAARIYKQGETVLIVVLIMLMLLMCLPVL